MRRLTILLFALLAVCESASAGAESAAGKHFERAAQGAVAASIAVTIDGEIVWTHHVGQADPLENRPASDATRYRIHSLAKPVTAVAALRLMGAGILDPDAPIDTWLDSYPREDVGSAVTVRMLATHRSGIRHYRDEDEARGARHCETTADALSIFASDPLVAEPGAGKNYSTWGFVLLSHVLAQAADVPFDDLLHRYVLDPLGMDGYARDDPRSDLAHLARSYRLVDGKPAEDAPFDNSCKWGGGGYVATVVDMARFASALVGPSSPLDDRTRDALFRGEDRYTASGWGAGGMSYLLADRANGIGVVVLTNTLNPEIGERLVAVRDAIAEEFVTREGDGPAESPRPVQEMAKPRAPAMAAVERETIQGETGEAVQRALLPHPEREGARVEVFWVPPSDRAAGPLLLYLHGWQPDQQGARTFVDANVLQYQARQGYLAAAVSQPGYGDSDGPADYCGPATQQAVETAIEYLLNETYADGRVVLYGFSRGAFVAGMVATRIPNLTGVVLISGAYDMASFYEHLEDGSGLKSNIETESGITPEDFAARSTLLHADRITAPVLIIHGTDDETVPVEQARRLAASLEARDHPVHLETVEGAGHFVPFAARRAAVNPFLAELLGLEGDG